jgi:hypothetical protein
MARVYRACVKILQDYDHTGDREKAQRQLHMLAVNAAKRFALKQRELGGLL